MLETITRALEQARAGKAFTEARHIERMKQRRISIEEIRNCLKFHGKMVIEHDIRKCIRKVDNKVIIVVFRKKNNKINSNYNLQIFTCSKIFKISGAHLCNHAENLNGSRGVTVRRVMSDAKRHLELAEKFLEEGKALNPKTHTPDFNARSASYRATRRFSSSRFLLLSEL
jgi:hypothetical protein